MSTFVVLAALMALGACACVAIPLLRTGENGARAAPWAALGCAAILLAGAALLYVNWSNWNWAAPVAADTPQAMVSQLARRLEKQPDDLDGWLMLGRSYAALEQFPLAMRAYEHADRLAQGRNPEALIGEAEALAMQNEAEIDGRAGRLFERALALAPTSGKALFFTAVAASRRGDLKLARERFNRLLELNPPQNIRAVLTAQIKAIDERLAGRVPALPAAEAAAPANDAVIRVTVRLSPKLAGSVGTAPLFVLVRDPQAPGPPLAAKRLESHFPQQVELTPRDSMIAGHSFRKGQTVQLVARIARGGTPVAQSGDPYGALDYTVGTDGLRDVVIDQFSP